MPKNGALNVLACVAILFVVSVGGAGQNPQAPAGGVQEQGRGANPPGRQGGGGARPNFPQQQRPLADPAVIARGRRCMA
jgi:hypothetical protein